MADIQVLYEFSQAGEATELEVEQGLKQTEKLFDDLEFRNMLSNEEDGLSAILQVNSGAGGTESQDWAQMLMRMYIRWAERNNYKVRELDLNEGDVAGIKSVSIEIEGDRSKRAVSSTNHKPNPGKCQAGESLPSLMNKGIFILIYQQNKRKLSVNFMDDLCLLD